MRTRERDPDLLAIDDGAANDVFSALSSQTARLILTTLYDQPRTASEIADEVETSPQNVNYHLNQLKDCNLIEVAETWYSEQGKDMKVYAPTNQALVLFAGDELKRSSLLDAIKQLIGFIGVFAVLSLIINRLARPKPTQQQDIVGSVGPNGGQTPVIIQPGVLFFLGSVVALILFAVWWHHRSLL